MGQGSGTLVYLAEFLSILQASGVNYDGQLWNAKKLPTTKQRMTH